MKYLFSWQEPAKKKRRVSGKKEKYNVVDQTELTTSSPRFGLFITVSRAQQSKRRNITSTTGPGSREEKQRA